MTLAGVSEMTNRRLDKVVRDMAQASKEGRFGPHREDGIKELGEATDKLMAAIEIAAKEKGIVNVFRQYITAEFRKGSRAYTYHNDGEPVAPGDRIVVQGRGGPQVITVVELLFEVPTFETKPIVGLERSLADQPEGNLL